jgi:hypothetical protein
MAPSIHKKLAITSPTSGGRSVGIVCSRTQTMEFIFFNTKRMAAVSSVRGYCELKALFEVEVEVN